MLVAWYWVMAGCTFMSNPRHFRSLPNSARWLRAQILRTSQDEPGAGVLIPASSIASQALVTVIAIMAFLAALTAGGAILVRNASQAWSNQITEEVTVQIKPQAGRNIETDLAAVTNLVKAFPGITMVRAFSKDESAKLLEPWLGTLNSIDDLPVPRLIIVNPSKMGFELAKLKAMLSDKAPYAILDDHRLWFQRLNTMASTFVIIALLILGLIIAVMALAIGFATRGAMAGTQDIIEVLHFVGAQNRFISQEFQKHFFRLGLKGALIGGGSAAIFFLSAGSFMSSMISNTQAEQVEALFGDFSLGWVGYGMVAAIILGTPIFVSQISRKIVLRHLRMIR